MGHTPRYIHSFFLLFFPLGVSVVIRTGRLRLLWGFFVACDGVVLSLLFLPDVLGASVAASLHFRFLSALSFSLLCS